MDRTPEHLVTFAVLAELEQGTGQSRTVNEEPGSLLDMFRNTNFTSANREVHTDEPGLHDDLPPLEDEAGPSNPGTARSPHSQEDGGLPPLETDRGMQATASVATSSVEITSNDTAATVSGGAPLSTIIASSATTSPPVRIPPRRARRIASTDISSRTANAGDAGAESDDSLPSLQTVSDSSSEGEDVDDTSSDWDDGSFDSDDESNIAQMIENAERTFEGQPPNRPPTIPNAFAHVEPDTQFDPERFSNTIQTYRELLERARVLIPDIDARFQIPPELVADLTMRGAGVDNDPKRAETLLEPMETVTDDLVRRYEKLRAADTEDADTDGCVICREDLLDKSASATEAFPLVQAYALLPFHPEMESIIVFPCAGKHLFHRACLSPWLARKTTCPTCRFDIDPLSLTLRLTSGAGAIAPDASYDPSRPARTWKPPQVESLRDWLDAEEKVKETGVRRERPPVVMPDYPPLPPRHHTDPVPTRPVRPAGTPLSELFEGTTIEWGYDTTANISMSNTYRDIQEMHRRVMDADVRRQHLEDFIMQAMPAPERRTEVPSHPPLVPPVAPSEASQPSVSLPQFSRNTSSNAAPVRPVPFRSIFGTPQSSQFLYPHPTLFEVLNNRAAEIEERRERERRAAGVPHPPLPGAPFFSERATQLSETPLIRHAPLQPFEVVAMNLASEPNRRQPAVPSTDIPGLRTAGILESLRTLDERLHILEDRFDVSRSLGVTSTNSPSDDFPGTPPPPLEPAVPTIMMTRREGATPSPVTAAPAGSIGTHIEPSRTTATDGSPIPYLSNYNPVDGLD